MCIAVSPSGCLSLLVWLCLLPSGWFDEPHMSSSSVFFVCGCLSFLPSFPVPLIVMFQSHIYLFTSTCIHNYILHVYTDDCRHAHRQTQTHTHNIKHPDRKTYADTCISLHFHMYTRRHMICTDHLHLTHNSVQLGKTPRELIKQEHITCMYMCTYVSMYLCLRPCM